MEPSRIYNLEVTGFRSLRKVEWHPGTLNVVIGQNASGKSNLLKCLQLIAAATNGRLREYVDSHRGIGSMLWGGQDRYLTIETLTDVETATGRRLHYILELRRVDKTLDYRIAEKYQVVDKRGGTESEYDRDHEIVGLDSINLSDNTMAGFERAAGSPETLLSTAKSPFVSEQHLRAAQETLSSFLILDDFHTDSNAALRQPVTSRLETQLDQNGQNLPEVLHSLYETDYEFKDRIDAGMSAVFGDAYKELAFPPAAEQQIQLGVRWSALQRPEIAANLSDGTLRFLFIITALSLPNPPVIIAIDEPETGLHPTMMRVIAEYAADAALRSQIIFTTHSTAFLDAFSKDDPPTVTVAEIQNGETTLKVVDPDLLAHWLSDYSLGTLYRSKELEQMDAAPAKVENAA